jgi:LEA14-like dessication related protein
MPTGTLAAQQRTEIPVQVSLPLPTAPDALARLLAWLRMTVEVEGGIVAEGTRIPFAGTREVATPRLPRVVVQEAQVASVDRGQKGVAFFSLGLDNPNSFDIVVDKFAWGARVGDKELLPVGEGSVERVPPSSVATFEDTLQLNPETYGKGVRKLLRQARVPYRLEGFVEIRGIHQPFEFEGEMEFAR